MAKVISRDNYNRDNWHGDEKILEEGLSDEAATELAKLWNATECGDRFYVVVPDEYVLPPPWEP